MGPTAFLFCLPKARISSFALGGSLFQAKALHFGWNMMTQKGTGKEARPKTCTYPTWDCYFYSPMLVDCNSIHQSPAQPSDVLTRGVVLHFASQSDGSLFVKKASINIEQRDPYYHVISCQKTEYEEERGICCHRDATTTWIVSCALSGPQG